MIRTSSSALLRRSSLALAAVAMLAAGAARAQLHSYTLSGTLTALDATAPGFPPSLLNLAVGMTFEMSVTYPFQATPSLNPFGGLYASASLYTSSPYTATLRVGPHTLSSWQSPLGLVAFVWNDDTIGLGSSDGLLFTNAPAPGQPQFRMGNLLLPASTFGGEALPAQTLNGGFALTVGLAGSADWLFGEGTSLVFSAPVPELPPAALLAAGLVVLALRRRR